MSDSYTLKTFFENEVETPDTNIIGTYTTKDKDGKEIRVVMVLDDSPEKLESYSVRSDEVQFIKSERPVAWQIPTRKFRPAPGGVSVGHYNITAGTLGCYVVDNTTGKICVLSNNHVLADVNKANKGDAIYQPGPYDGGTNADTLARLTRFIRITGGVTVDCAAAEVVKESDVDLNILNIGQVAGITSSYVGQKIWKFGRTSELSTGFIEAIDGVIEVDYGGPVYVIRDCVISRIYGGPGDSGSAILDFASNCLVGLLFAGGGGYTIICKATNIATQLNVRTVTPTKISRSMFVDISHWNKPFNFAKFKAMGGRGVILKVSEGDNFTDPDFAAFYDEAKSLGLLVGGYIFVKPSKSAKGHFDNYIKSLGSRKLDFTVALDCEDKDGQTAQMITSVIQNLSKLVTEYQNGQRPFIYTSMSFWKTYVLPWDEWALHPLWVALWVWDSATYPDVPYSWKDSNGKILPGKPEIWQFTVLDNGKALGAPEKLDIDVTYESFEKLIGEPTPADEYTLVVNISGNGTVTPNSNSKWPSGTILNLTATPASGWTFHGWSGDLVSTANPVSLIMDNNKTVTATFVQASGEPKVFEHNKGKTLVSGQYYRTGPGTAYRVLGSFPVIGTIVEILELKKDSYGNDWARIGYNEWTAFLYKGRPYLEYIV